MSLDCVPSAPNPGPHQVALIVHASCSAALVAIGSDDCVILINSESSQVLQVLGPHAAPVSCIDWSRDDGRLAVGVGRQVVTYRADDRVGPLQLLRDGHALHDEPVAAVAWAPIATSATSRATTEFIVVTGAMRGDR